MTYTTTQLEALKRALATGERRVSFGDKTVEYRSVEELQAAIRTVEAEIARNAGATVRRDGSESEAYLQIPPASLDTRMTEMVEQQFAEVDYQVKKQAKQFWDFLAGVQEVRRGVQHARHQSAE